MLTVAEVVRYVSWSLQGRTHLVFFALSWALGGDKTRASGGTRH